jgi:hypothetical protein
LHSTAAADELANGRTDLVSAAQGFSFALDAPLNLLHVLFSSIEQLVALRRRSSASVVQCGPD